MTRGRGRAGGWLRIGRAALVALALLPAAAAAQEVTECDWRARADAIAEPWEDNTRSFANGAVRVALIDLIEPAATPYYLLILSPPRDLLGARQCRLVGFEADRGFASLDFAALKAGYDPARGLTLTLPGALFLAEEGFYNGLLLHVTVNQATGEITAMAELGRE